jgi:hypothetical protein
MSTGSTIKVKLSVDGGTTWKDYVEAPSTTTTNPTPTPTTSPTPPTSTTSTGVDKNGIFYLQPLDSDGYQLPYSNETFTFTKNFRSDGSMRMDFRVRNSVFLAGYFKVTGSDND